MAKAWTYLTQTSFLDDYSEDEEAETEDAETLLLDDDIKAGICTAAWLFFVLSKRSTAQAMPLVDFLDPFTCLPASCVGTKEDFVQYWQKVTGKTIVSFKSFARTSVSS